MPHYNFVEIGTADFDCIVQTCDDNVRGLCVDPMKVYLDRLPNKPLVKKRCIAISDRAEAYDTVMYYVDEEAIERHKLPNWYKGSTSIGVPHGLVLQDLFVFHPNVVARDVIKTSPVSCMTVKDLWEQEQITSLAFLKIDTEGFDCRIMNQLKNFYDQHAPTFEWPERIQFESNKNSNPSDVLAIIQAFQQRGYTLDKVGEDTVLVKANTQV